MPGQHRTTPTPSRAPLVWIGGVIGSGVAISLLLFGIVLRWEHREEREQVQAIVREQADKLHVSILRSLEVLHSLAALHRVTGGFDPTDFRTFVGAALERQPELQAVSWNPLVPAGERDAFETAARRLGEGRAGFTIRELQSAGGLSSAEARTSYVPILLIEPLAKNQEALGYDLQSDLTRRGAIEEARDTGRATATVPIALAQLPGAQAGILVLLPIYRGAATPPAELAERRERLAGFAVAVFRVADLVGHAFAELRAKGIDASLFDVATDGPLIHGAPDPRQTGQVRLDVAGRPWELRFGPAPGASPGGRHRQSWMVLAGGLAFTGLGSAYLRGSWRRTAQIAAANAALEEEVRVREKAEAEAAAANRAKSDFLASMSHEIRTPLNAILGYAQLLERDPVLGEEQRDAVHGIRTGSHHLLGLINEILDLAKIEAGRMELRPVPFDLRALGRGLAATFRPLGAARNLRLRVEIDGTGSACVLGDEGKLRQVLINLLGNALKFTPAGEICLRAHAAADAPELWTFEVIDTGLGIPAEEQPEIFKPFHQGRGARHQGGTGLGLAIAQRQVELLGGRLELQSERGIGSRFYFSIPLPAALPLTEPETTRPARLAAGQRVHALVVDDQPENREVIGRLLRSLGCVVTTVAGGEPALDILRQRPDDLDIVFLDLLLPDRSGIEVTCAIRTGLANPPPVVLLTAAALPEHQRAGRAAGAVDFLSKPVAAETLQECLQRHLGAVFEALEFTAPAGTGEDVLPAGRRLELPENLVGRLQMAAELHSSTALKAALAELRALGGPAATLAAAVRDRLRSFDMDGIQKLLADTVVTARATTPGLATDPTPAEPTTRTVMESHGVHPAARLP